MWVAAVPLAWDKRALGTITSVTSSTGYFGVGDVTPVPR